MREVNLQPLFALAEEMRALVMKAYAKDMYTGMFSREIQKLVEKYINRAGVTALFDVRHHDDLLFELGPLDDISLWEINEYLGIPTRTHWSFLLPQYILHKGSILSPSETVMPPR